VLIIVESGGVGMASDKFEIYAKILHEGEVNKARYMPQVIKRKKERRRRKKKERRRGRKKKKKTRKERGRRRC
jgi:hypothetical protein